MCPVHGVYVGRDLIDITTYHISWGYSLILDIETLTNWGLMAEGRRIIVYFYCLCHTQMA